MFSFLTTFTLAATWTMQAEKYYTYNTTPTKPLPTLKRVLTTDITTVQPTWIRIGGIWTKEVSTGGSVRYFEALAPIIIPPVSDECDGKFVCHPQWGWIVRISQNQSVKCLEIKIKADQAFLYEGLQAGSATCN